MSLPEYYLPRPVFTLDAATRAACDALLVATMTYPGDDITDRLPVPPWQFLCYLADHHPVVLHGSGNPAITTFVPRKSNDHNPFGNRCAVYAASDGIWPIFFAIVAGEQYPLSLMNACFRVVSASGVRSDPYYFFSIIHTALPHQPWRAGTVYILPRTTFEQHPPNKEADVTYEVMEWASLTAVQPYAKVTVLPHDFPFLEQVRGHDEDVVAQRAAADPNGWPWVTDP